MLRRVRKNRVLRVRLLALSVFVVAIAACSTDVAADLDERQSAEMLATLAQAGVPAERHAAGDGKDTRYRIDVPSRDSGRAAALLHAEGLPREAKRGFRDLYGSSNLIPSAAEEKARFLDALSGAISSHLEHLDGVRDASVLVNIPDGDPLASADSPRPKSTASVLLRLRPNAAAPDEREVRSLVAASAQGLSPEDVVVVSEAPSASPAELPTFASIGPISVAQSSKAPLVGILAVGCLIIIGLGGMAAWALAREHRA